VHTRGFAVWIGISQGFYCFRHWNSAAYQARSD